MKPTRSDIGRAGEFLVMSRLSELGYYCVHSDSYSDDVWVKDGKGNMFTIQVKTVTEYKRRGPHSAHRYTFCCNGTNADFYALVALDRQRILYQTLQQFSKKTLRLPYYKFTEQAEHDSLLFCLDQIADVTARDPDVV